MEILYNFNSYKKSRTGLFAVIKDSSKYIIPGGWEQKKELHTIIGETDDSFVTRLLISISSTWEDGIVKHQKIIIPIGLHKSRLIEWNGQLALL